METASDDNDLPRKRGGNLVIGIIGAGKVGTTLGAYFSCNGIKVSGFYSRTYRHAAEAADFTKTKAYSDIKQLIRESDTLLITTPDGEIKNVWDCISSEKLDGKVICHFSGSLSSHVFSGIEAAGAVGCSIHPMFAFCDRFHSYQTFSAAVLTVEGQKEALDRMCPLFEGLGHRVLVVKAENKMKYHAAAAFASNYMIGLFHASLSLLADCGFSEEESRLLLNPLVRNNVQTMLEKPLTEALTGPIERKDMQTIRGHFAALADSNAEEIYRCIGRELAVIAKQKNPDRDYTELDRLFS